MQWHEDSGHPAHFKVPDDIVDLVFRVSGERLPADHAHGLHTALYRALPWWEDEEGAGVYINLGAEEGNGWYRGGSAMLYLSRRARLVLRLPKTRLQSAASLAGEVLEVGGHQLRLGGGATRLLSDHRTLYSRHVVGDTVDESAFIGEVLAGLNAMGVICRKILCGKARRIALPDGKLLTRSVMLADLTVEDAVLLQQQGLGPARKLGCGLFVPYKSVAAVDAHQNPLA